MPNKYYECVCGKKIRSDHLTIHEQRCVKLAVIQEKEKNTEEIKQLKTKLKSLKQKSINILIQTNNANIQIKSSM